MVDPNSGNSFTFFAPLKEEIDEVSNNEQSSLLAGFFNKFFKTSTLSTSPSTNAKINNNTPSSVSSETSQNIEGRSNSFANISIADEALDEIISDKSSEEKNKELKKYDQSEFKRYWVPDSTGKECYDCHERFNAFRRKHHCRICGQIFCAKCTNNTVDGAVLGYREFLRVCNYCKTNVKSNDKNLKVNEYDSDEECVLKGGDDKPYLKIDNKSITEIGQNGYDFPFEPTNNVNSVSKNFQIFNGDQKKGLDSFNSTNDINLFQPTNVAYEKQLPTFLNIDDLAKSSGSADYREAIDASTNFKKNQRKKDISVSSMSDTIEPEWVRNIEMVDSGTQNDNKTDSDSSISINNTSKKEKKLFNSWNDANDIGSSIDRKISISAVATTLDLKEAFDDKLDKLLDTVIEKEQIDKLKWKTLILNLSKEINDIVEIDVKNRGDHMNILKYVHIKKLCCDVSKPSAKLVNGIICSKNIAHANMASKIHNGSVMMLSGSIEYERVTDKLSFIDHILQQEKGYLSNQIDRIISRLPSILIVENSVACVALEMLLENNVCLIHNTKPKVMKRIARVVGSDILPAFDAQILNQRIGYINHFSQETIILRGGEKKTLLIFQQESGVKGVSVLLKASSTRELKAAKRILKLVILARYSARLEIALFEMFNIKPVTSTSTAAKCLTCQLNTMDLEEITNEGFLSKVNNCHIGWSPYISVGPPYMETKRGFTSSIKQYFKDNLFPSGSIEDYKMLANDEDKKENDLFRSKEELKFLLEEIDRSIQHSFIKENIPLLNDIDDDITNYRARSGKIFKNRCYKKNTMEKELMEKQVHLADDVNSPLRILQNNDVFNPQNHQRISYLFGSFTKKSSNPFFCVLPYVLKMEFYSQHDMCLGMFLSKFCFNEDYKCYDQACSVPMIDHQRKIVHRKVRIEIISQKFVQSFEDLNLTKNSSSAFSQENIILCWQHCPSCKISSVAIPITHEVWHLSFAKYIEYLANSINCINIPKLSTSKNTCNHCSFHDHQHFFAYNEYVTSFKVYPIKPFHVQFSPTICSIEPRFVSISGLNLEFKKLDALSNDLFDKITENLLKLKTHPSGIRYQLVHDTVKAFLEQTKTDVCEVLESIDKNDIFQSTNPILSDDETVLKIKDSLNWCKHKLYSLTTFWNEEAIKINSQTKAIKKMPSNSISSIEDTSVSIITNLSSSHLSVPSIDTNIPLELTTIYDPFPNNMHLELPQIKNRICIIVKDFNDKKDSIKPDFGSIIAYALASDVYKEERVKLRHHKNCMDTPLNLKLSNNQKKDDISSKNYEVHHQKNHIDITFEDSIASYFVNVYYAEHFHMLRKICFGGSEDMFLRSLSTTTMWKPQGGKSGSDFYRTDDKRFVFKEMAKSEIDFFLTFAPKYFDYIYTSIMEKKLTCLGKIYGVYRVGYKNKKNNSQYKMDILVMEYLFYKRNIKQYWDLKGSLRNRKAYPEKHHAKDQVLLDENFVNNLWNNQFYVHPHAKTALSQAIDNDSKFLSTQKIMDYSLLVGVDSENDEVILGIVDYMRPYTIDKQIESAVKKAALPGNQLPTIINPEDYRIRFTEAINNHYIHVAPDQWTGLASTSGF
uniref:1-phosphatidylinositol-3-phosphate 5-kinase n=1 Tax=Parastrongyloides trichosuri TaxID=131310 RepID=A0A0N4ZTH4_PARTI